VFLCDICSTEVCFCAIIFGREKCVFVRYLFERSVFLCDNIWSREVCFCAIIFGREKCVSVRECLFERSVFLCVNVYLMECILNRRCRGKSNIYYIQCTWSRSPTIFSVMKQQ
jgi:hypothetical protein